MVIQDEWTNYPGLTVRQRFYLRHWKKLNRLSKEWNRKNAKRRNAKLRKRYRDPARRKAVLEYNRAWRFKHKEKLRRRDKYYYARHKKELRAKQRRLYHRRKHIWAANNKRLKAIRLARIKTEVQTALGGKCNCPGCGEARPLFLCLDHINGGGSRHRREAKINNMYVWMDKFKKRNGHYPKYIQLLCYNCNFAKGESGFCPVHQKRRRRKQR